jgi:UDP-N-acetylmuramate: L-alanyl-gamma-D-glutamyl-meso-diaminopimelate ligase
VTEQILDIHFIAIGGTGMAPLACLLKEMGHRVRGSDNPLYPPMSTLLQAAGIEPMVGFDVAHLDPKPDLVVVGNAVPRHNPQALETERLGIPRISMPEALSRFFLSQRRPLVVAGTHGKTTTTSMASWVYTACATDPGFLVGGVPRNLGCSFHQGSGPRFIIEGDEYNAAYFDRGAKFLHYQPETAILTSVEYDHADLYPDPASLTATYERLVSLPPRDGLLVACGDSPEVRRVSQRARCPVIFYGLEKDNDLHPLGPVETGPEGSRFRVLDAEVGEVEIHLPMTGLHNVCNLLAVWAVARRDGLEAGAVVSAFARFEGIKRRLEEIGTQAGVTVIDDFAHHPTAVGKTLLALRERYPERRLVVAFEPRSLTAGRSFFHQPYLEAFSEADRVFLAPIFHAQRLGIDERLDLEALANELTERGVATTGTGSYDDLLQRILAEARRGDVIVTMSSGKFDELPRRLLAGLEGA